MKNSASMRPDQMLVTTQGIRGGKKHTNKQGNCRIAVMKAFNEPTNSIEVDVFTGLGHNYSPAETALLNITFADGKQFNGTFDQLKEKLFPETNFKFGIGEKVRWHYGKHPHYFVLHGKPKDGKAIYSLMPPIGGVSVNIPETEI